MAKKQVARKLRLCKVCGHMSLFSLSKIRWANSVFLIATFVTTFTAVPLYLYHHGLSAFQLWMFVGFFIATGLSITLGYHRLFSHLTFQANWTVKLFTLLFGAAAFEGSAILVRRSPPPSQVRRS